MEQYEKQCAYCRRLYRGFLFQKYCYDCRVKSRKIDSVPNLTPLIEGGWQYVFVSNFLPGWWEHPDHRGKYSTDEAFRTMEGLK